MRHKERLLALAGVTMIALAALSGAPAVADRKEVVAPMKDIAGNSLGRVLFERSGGKTLVTARVFGLSPGFHGFHVHAVGKCNPDPSGTTNVPFGSAGAHFNPSNGIHSEHAGDMPPLLVAADGTAHLSFKTDRFKIQDLFDADGSALIIHSDKDNLSHIPATTPTGAERYHSHTEGVLGPDSASKATGDAGSRFGCGVVGPRD